MERGNSALAQGSISTLLLLLLYDLATPKFASDLLAWIMAPLASAAQGGVGANPSTAYLVA